ncbi:MAG: hypothetical protein LBD06_12415 [Candidatus Accumulibacter sp.]|nr:hypothetical protein [Accumulibacter sp.]
MRGQKTEKPGARSCVPYPARSAASSSVICLLQSLSSETRALGFPLIRREAPQAHLSSVFSSLCLLILSSDSVL